MRDSSSASRWFVQAVVVAAFAAVPLGCGGEPTGDDAYSQKFEPPPEGAAPEAAPANPYSERRAEIEKAQESAPPAKP